MKTQYRIEKREQEGKKKPVWDVEVSRDGGQTWNWNSRWERRRNAEARLLMLEGKGLEDLAIFALRVIAKNGDQYSRSYAEHALELIEKKETE